MNLIEQLGGYEKAKELTDHVRGNESLHMVLARELLQHRRQHNIFEAGDFIVVDSYKPEYQFYQIAEDDMGSHWINLVEFRHATDAEIKAGRRL